MLELRSNIKDVEFYLRRIKETTEIQAKSEEKLAAGLVANDRVPSVKRMVFSQFLHLLIRKFSAGFSITDIEADFRSAFDLIQEIWPDEGSEDMPDYLKDWYVKMLWMLTFGIFFKISDEDFTRIVSVWDKTGRRDWLIDYLVAYRIPNRPKVDTLIFPKPYATLKKAVDESDPLKRSAIVKHYLEKEWYPGHKGLYWHENHKSQHDTFFGYWSFESAAVVKIAGIDDSSFRDNMYYPKDLL